MTKANGGLHRAATLRRVRFLKLALTAVAVTLAVACGAPAAPVADPGRPNLDAVVVSMDYGVPDGPEVYSIGYTYANASGNRYFSGTGGLGTDELSSASVRFGVSGFVDIPMWLTAAIHPDGGAVWVVTGVDGKSVAFRTGLYGGGAGHILIDFPLETFSLSPPILVIGKSGQVGLTTTRAVDGLDTLLPGARIEFIEDGAGNGNLRITRGDRSSTISVRNAPDATFMIGSDSTLYSYVISTDRYPHGAIGDQNEWGGVTALPVGDGAGAGLLLLNDDDVFEGLYPILADFDGDGVEEIIGTVSNRTGGARLIVIENGKTGMRIAAESEPIGTAFRWTHQVAVAPFGPNGEMELATIRTPHIGGVAEFYRLSDGKLERVASLSGGYSSHVNGSRNLDMAVAGDFDGDGNVELLVPSRNRLSLVALRRSGESAEEVWELWLGSPLATNLAGVVLPDGSDGRIILGAVTRDGELLIWQ